MTLTPDEIKAMLPDAIRRAAADALRRAAAADRRRQSRALKRQLQAMMSASILNTTQGKHEEQLVRKEFAETQLQVPSSDVRVRLADVFNQVKRKRADQVVVSEPNGKETSDDENDLLVIGNVLENLEQIQAQVAHLQGMRLQHAQVFPTLLRLLRSGDVWALNLADITFSWRQWHALLEAMRASQVSFLYAELEHPYSAWLKSQFEEVLRENRAKHDRYLFKDGHDEQNALISAVNHWTCWTSPRDLSANVAWTERQSKAATTSPT
jgi:hypothetical protein